MTEYNNLNGQKFSHNKQIRGQTKLFRFEYDVLPCRIIEDANHPYLKEYPKKKYPGPVIGFEPKGKIPFKTYYPFEKSFLFLRFANLKLDDENILDFYNNYGPLGISCIEDDGLCRNSSWYADWLWKVKDEILKMHFCLKLWRAINIDRQRDYDGYRKAKSFLSNVVRDRKVVRPTFDPFQNKVVEKEFGIKPTTMLRFISEDKQEERKYQASTFIIQTIEPFLNGVRPAFSLERGYIPQQVFTSYTLMNCLYYQFFIHITRAKPLSVCPVCGNFFEPKGKQLYCNPKCQSKKTSKDYYERHKKKKLKKGG